MLGRKRWGEGAGRTVWAFASVWDPRKSGVKPAGERGRKENGERRHPGAVGRREGPEAVKTAGGIVFLHNTLKPNRCNKNLVAFSLNMPQRPLVQQPLSIRSGPSSLSELPIIGSVWEKTNNYQAGILSRATGSEGAAAESPGQVRLLRRSVSRRGPAARPQRAELLSSPLPSREELLSSLLSHCPSQH